MQKLFPLHFEWLIDPSAGGLFGLRGAPLCKSSVGRSSCSFWWPCSRNSALWFASTWKHLSGWSVTPHRKLSGPNTESLTDSWVCVCVVFLGRRWRRGRTPCICYSLPGLSWFWASPGTPECAWPSWGSHLFSVRSSALSACRIKNRELKSSSRRFKVLQDIIAGRLSRAASVFARWQLGPHFTAALNILWWTETLSSAVHLSSLFPQQKKINPRVFAPSTWKGTSMLLRELGAKA